jgi:hypothetical protein
MTKELKEKLNGYLAITPDNTFKYVPAIYRDKKNNIPKKMWPVFTLKILDGQQIAEIEDNSGYIVTDMTNFNKREFHGMSGTKRIETLKKGIVGWTNLRDSAGKVINYIDETSIKLLAGPMQLDLVNAITEQTNLSEDELRGLE